MESGKAKFSGSVDYGVGAKEEKEEKRFTTEEQKRTTEVTEKTSHYRAN
jgi:hypothetical protein